MKIETLIATFLITISGCDLFWPDEELQLRVEDVSCTEVWLRVKGAQDSEMTLFRDDKEVKTFNFNRDTTIIDAGLKPSTTYEYQVSGDRYAESSNRVTATTMDTTSHEMTWQTFTFGDFSSALYDVAIIDENNIWAVGEIYLNDSTGQPDPKIYNAVHWEDNKWEILQIPTEAFGGWVGFYRINTILVFSNYDIWTFSIAGSYSYWNGQVWTTHFVPEHSGGGESYWGINSSNFYLSGTNGSISHYNGKNWQKLESGTETNLLDVYGEGNNIFLSGWADFEPTVLLKIENGNVVGIIDEFPSAYDSCKISGAIKSVWVKRTQLFALTWYDLYRSPVSAAGKNAKALWKGDPYTWGSNKVRGIDVNDIFVVGFNGTVWHFNGLSWKRYDELLNPTDELLSVAINGNTVAISGYRYLNGIDNYGLIIVGKKY
ncbi:MAG: hypothetical protein WC957_03470 [Candidatus Neomarinimicrobiota bacterium]|jgi:hypothetical protein